MSVVAADLLVPAGEIDGALFYPALLPAAVTTLLTQYLTAAAVTLAQVPTDDMDRATIAYVYYRAYSDVVLRLTTTPQSVSIAGELSASFSGQQLQVWIDAANRYRLLYLSLIPPVATTRFPGGSESVATVVRF